MVSPLMLMGLMMLNSSMDLYSMVLLGLGGILLFTFVLYKNQEGMLYQPRAAGDNPEGYRDPSDRKLPYEDVQVETEDGLKLHCWFIKRETPEATRQARTILFFHANAGNMGFRLENLQQMYETYGVNIFIVSYRGYGHSEGTPSEAGLCMDAEAAFVYLKTRSDVDISRVTIFGRSLGGAVAIALASRHGDEVASLIVENTFSSISDLVDTIFSYLKPIKPWVLRLKWKSRDRISKISCPILFLSGLQDEVVPFFHMRTLYDLATAAEFRQISCFSAGKHNDTWKEGGEAYTQIVTDFLNRET
jgi:fermentation-respiration switch protein FrsA (DUF1100 family)